MGNPSVTHIMCLPVCHHQLRFPETQSLTFSHRAFSPSCLEAHCLGLAPSGGCSSYSLRPLQKSGFTPGPLPPPCPFFYPHRAGILQGRASIKPATSSTTAFTPLLEVSSRSVRLSSEGRSRERLRVLAVDPGAWTWLPRHP